MALGPPSIPARHHQPPVSAQAIAETVSTDSLITRESLASSFQSTMQVLGALGILAAAIIITVCVFLLAGKLPSPEDLPKDLIGFIGLMGLVFGGLYLAGGMGALLRQTWAIYTLLVLGYIGAFNAVLEIISGNWIAGFNLWLASSIIQHGHTASTIRRQLREVQFGNLSSPHFSPVTSAVLLSCALLPLSVGAADLSWRSTSLGASSSDNVTVAVHPDGSFLAADGFDIRRSVNSGTNWTTVTGFAMFAGGSFGIDPSDPSILYAGRSHGLLKSANGGASWFELEDLNAGGSARSIVIAPSEPATVFVGVGHGWGVYKSRNRGGTWSNVLTSRHVESLAVHPANPLVVLAATIKYYSTDGCLLQTVDGGTNWTPRLLGKDVTAVVFDSATPAGAYAGTAADGIYRSTDGGETWEQLLGSLTLGPVAALAVHPANPRQVFVAIKAGGIFTSSDGGSTWRSQNEGLADLNVIALSIRSTPPFTLLAGTYGGKAFWTNPELQQPPSPATLSLAFYAGITISGDIGRLYQVQYRTDLDPADSWHHLAEVRLSQTQELFVDRAPASRRFYRALALP